MSVQGVDERMINVHYHYSSLPLSWFKNRKECDTGIVRSLSLSDFRQNSLAGELGSQAIIIERERERLVF